MKNFLKRYWNWITGGLILLGLFFQRALILRQVSKLRTKLTASQLAADQAKSQAAIETHATAIQHHMDMAGVHEASAAVIQADIQAAEETHEGILAAINNAQSPDALERLRQAGNARR